MQASICRMVLLAGACMTCGMALAQHQNAPAEKAGQLDVAVTYSADRSSALAGSSFWMQGGGVQIHGQFWKGLGAVGDVTAVHTNNITGTGVGLELVTATFGPRFTVSLDNQRLEIFGQALAGVANGLNSTFPNYPNPSSTANGMAVNIGGGVNVRLNARFSFRAAQLSWLRTGLPNSNGNVENQLLCGSGLVMHF